MPYKIQCRAQVSKNCYHLSPTRLQFGEDIPMSEDITYIAMAEIPELGTIVCDPCYAHLAPLTPSGGGFPQELDVAILKVREERGLSTP